MKDAKTKASSANEVLNNTREDHAWLPAPQDLNSTGGIQRAIIAQWHAIQALADYIDGVATGTTDDKGQPVKTADAADKSPAAPPPAAPFSTVSPAPAPV
jgi:hypothetical protein